MHEPDKSRQPPQDSSSLGLSGWIAIIVLAGFLAGGVLYAIHGWSAVPSTTIPPLGWTFLILGVVVTVLVGGGLMALLFYSSRKGKDF